MKSQGGKAVLISLLPLLLLPLMSQAETGWQALLQNAYQAEKAGQRDQAYQYFQQATQQAPSPAHFEKSCMGVVYNAPLMRKSLPDPYYLTFYLNPLYMHRAYQPQTDTQQDFDDLISTFRVRAGRYLDHSRQFSLYGQLFVQKDTASKWGSIPEVYNDNYAGLGIGADYRPFSNTRIYVETSYDYDLEQRQNRERGRLEGKGGIEYYNGWGAINPRCSGTAHWPFEMFSDLYGALTWYSRYDNWIGQLTGRIGLVAYRQHFTQVNAYLLGNTTLDSQGLFYNNALEVGPGLEIRPHIAWPLSLRAEYRFGHYVKNLPAGYTDRYDNLIVQAIFYFEK